MNASDRAVGTMWAVVYDEIGIPGSLRRVREPECPADGVLVAVSATGVCRSDWHAWVGHDPVSLPHVPGHEWVGRVAAVGPAVRRWSVGDRVTAPFVCGCGRCEVCLGGDPQVCPRQTQPGFTGWGSFAETVAIHAADTNLVAVPEAVEDVAAAALGCRFATAYRAVTAHGGLRPGQWLAVQGSGGVGASAVAIGVALGARVVAVDVSHAALDLARRLGAEATVSAAGLNPDEVGEAVTEATGGGAHVGVDALGSVATARSSILGLRRRGRHVQAGLLFGDTPLPMDRVVAWELSLHGTHGLAAVDYPGVYDLLGRGIDLATLVGRVIGLEDAPAALAAMDRPGTTPGLTVVDLRRGVGSR